MKTFFPLLCAAAIGAFVANDAMAQTFPTSIVGAWTIRANDTQPFTFAVQQQSADSPCAQITGVMGAPSDPIAGYYCPSTGAVSFLRNSASSGATYQVFTGQVSWASNGSVPTQMTGNFSNYAGGDNTGAFSFAASLPSQ